MRFLVFIFISLFLFSCGNNQFAKRRYTKGVYVEKRGTASSRKSKVESGKWLEAKKGSRKKNNSATVNAEKKELSTINYPLSKEKLIVESNSAKHDNDQKPNPPQTIEDGLVKEVKDPEVKAEESELSPPELEDGEVLRRTKTGDNLGLAAGILGYTALGLFLLTGLLLFILWLVYLSGAISVALVWIITQFVYYGSLIMGIAALVMGAISYAKEENGMALAGIIIGAIFALILLITIIVVLV